MDCRATTDGCRVTRTQPTQQQQQQQRKTEGRQAGGGGDSVQYTAVRLREEVAVHVLHACRCSAITCHRLLLVLVIFVCANVDRESSDRSPIHRHKGKRARSRRVGEWCPFVHFSKPKPPITWLIISKLMSKRWGYELGSLVIRVMGFGAEKERPGFHEKRTTMSPSQGPSDGYGARMALV